MLATWFNFIFRPTGSGKTTSMYELLRVFADCQIMCIEDPIEIYQSDFLQL